MALRISTPDNEPADYYLNETGKLLDRYKGPLDTVVDLGAHVGCFSMLAAAEFGAKLVFAVEADPVNFSHLIINIEANGLTDKIFPILACISDRSFAVVDLFLSGTSGQRSVTWDPQRFPYVKVLTLSLPSLMNLIPFYGEFGGERPIDFLKVDIEGSEFKSLNNGLQRVKYIDLEMHPAIDPAYHTKMKRGQVKGLIDYLEAYGFRRATTDQGKWEFFGYKT